MDNTGATNTTRDDIRVSNLGQTNYPGYDGDTPLDPALNNLRIDRLAGDTDNDGSINVITTFGTRSFSIYDADTGDLVWDSGSFFETWIATNDPDSYPESRSVQKGPEPEAIAVGMVDGQRLAAIGLERSNHVFLFNITDPAAPVFQDFKLATDEFGNEHLRPESINFISAADSPTGQPLLVVGFEGDESRDSERLAIFAITQVPEPGSATLCGLVLALGAWRRRRASAPRSGGCRGGRYAGGR